MKPVQFPDGFRLERLARHHPRRTFNCGQAEVDDWLTSKAWQHQKKRLSAATALLASNGALAGFYTLATGQVDFGNLPVELTRNLPRRALPVAVLAWLGVDLRFQHRGLGARLMAQALRDCYDAGESFPFVAVVLDSLSAESNAFYSQWDFVEIPGQPFRFYLSAARLAAMCENE